MTQIMESWSLALASIWDSCPPELFSENPVATISCVGIPISHRKDEPLILPRVDAFTELPDGMYHIFGDPNQTILATFSIQNCNDSPLEINILYPHGEGFPYTGSAADEHPQYDREY